MSEFARPYRLDALGGTPLAATVTADAAERSALAERFALVALDSLTATAELVREGDEVRVAGTMHAVVIQACVATDAPVRATLDAPFALRFVPEAIAAAEAGEVELDEAALDLLPYAGGAIDLGEAVAQTLALSLDPWPRCAEADDALRAAGVLHEGEETEPGPFAKLKGLLGR